MSGKIVSREEWLAARKALLAKEKELTRANDALSAQRRELPMVRVDKEYTFIGPGHQKLTLSDLFAGKKQLIVYHFMFSPDDDGDSCCRGCSHIGESLPDVRHLRLKDTNLVCVSRGDIDKLEAFRQLNGWTWPWYSSAGSDFNYDFHATVDESVCPIELNFRTKGEMEAEGKRWWTGDVPGISVFVRGDGDEGAEATVNDKGSSIYHTYSAFARGVEKVSATLALLDLTPLGRQLGPYGPAEFKLKHEY